jgi:hypothetical protein
MIAAVRRADVQIFRLIREIAIFAEHSPFETRWSGMKSAPTGSGYRRRMAFGKAAGAGAACDGYYTERGNFAADPLQVQQSVFADGNQKSG